MPNASPSPRRVEPPDGDACFWAGGPKRGGTRTFFGEFLSFFRFFPRRHKRQPMCSRLVCDGGVMNVTAVIRTSAVSVLDIHENDGI